MKIWNALLLTALVGFPVVAQVETAPAKEDPVAGWVGTLVEKMGAENEVIRRSVERALVAVGEPAVPALEKVAAKGGDQAEAAKRMIEQIKNPRAGRPGGLGGGGQPGQGRGAGGRLGGDPFNGVELNADQKTKADKVMADMRAETTELMEAMRAGDLDRSEMAEAMQEIRAKAEKELKKFLTEDQMKKVSENLNNQRGGGRRRGGDGL